jgi:hypothetical protein
MSNLLWVLGILLFIIICLIGYAVIKALGWGGKQVKKGITKGSEAIKNRRTKDNK